ncbi:MAG: HNH endonuclease [Cetobacterium sp.]
MKNKYKICEEHVEIYINYKGNTQICYVDLEDFDLANSISLTWKWSHGYARATTTRNMEWINYDLHRMIYEKHNGKVPSGYVVDHINRNRLDNRKSNLRKLTARDNLRSVDVRNPNTLSGMKGIKFIHNKWEVTVCNVYGGRFVNLSDAKRRCNELRMVHSPLTVLREPIKIESL